MTTAAPERARWPRLAGHADQAHLVREFRRFTGTTPARFQTGNTTRRS